LELRGWKWQEVRENCIVRTFVTCSFTRYYYGDKIKRMAWVGHVARMGGMRNEYIILIGKSKLKRPLGNIDVDEK
jgi:hypothetical protein